MTIFLVGGIIASSFLIHFKWATRNKPKFNFEDELRGTAYGGHVTEFVIISIFFTLLSIYYLHESLFSSNFTLEELGDVMYVFSSVFIAWTIVVFERIRLVKKVSSRYILMASLTLVFILCEVLLTFVYLKYIYDVTIYSDYWVLELPFKVILFTGMMFALLKKDSSNNQELNTRLLVLKGALKKWIDHSDILYAIVQNQLTYVVTVKKERLLTNHTLSELESIIQRKDFMKVSRQMIVKKDAIVEYEPIENRKLKLKVVSVDGLPEVHIISRLVAPKFKQWVAA